MCWANLNLFRLASLSVFASALLLLAACGAERTEHAVMDAPPKPDVPIPPKRVVSLVPSFTEIIYALGEEDRLVGVTPYCKYPPRAQDKTIVGALVDVNYEKLLGLKPDYVLLVPGYTELIRDLQRLGVLTLTLPHETTEDILLAIRSIGDLLGAHDRAASLETSIRAELQEARDLARRRWNGLGLEAGPRVLFVAGRNPATLQQIYVCGSGNFVNEIIELVGATNVMGETTSPWPVISKESLIALDPEVILDSSIRQGDAPVAGDEHMQAWNQMPMLTAVREGRVVAVTDERISVPGPGVAESARKLIGLLAAALDAEKNAR